MDENGILEALDRHWAASDANDFDVERDICREDAVARVPGIGPSGSGHDPTSRPRAARSRTRSSSSRAPASDRDGGLWVTGTRLTYDGVPSYSVSVMEFEDGRVASETDYAPAIRSSRTFARPSGRANGMKSAATLTS